MNALAHFLTDNAHCTKWLCSTCGGLWGFSSHLQKWIDQDHPNLIQLIQFLTLEDLGNIQDWPIFLDLVFKMIPKEDKCRIESTPIYLAMIIELKGIHEKEAVERSRIEKAKLIDSENLEAKQKSKIEWFAQLSNLTMMDRLNAILDEKSYNLADYPSEWAVLPIESFSRYNSVELSRLISLLSQHKVPKRGDWKDLRSKLYQLRQQVYNREKGHI